MIPLKALTQSCSFLSPIATSQSHFAQVTDIFAHSFFKWFMSSYPRENILLPTGRSPSCIMQRNGHGTLVPGHSFCWCSIIFSYTKGCRSLQLACLHLNLNVCNLFFRYRCRGCPLYSSLHIGQLTKPYSRQFSFHLFMHLRQKQF